MTKEKLIVIDRPEDIALAEEYIEHLQFVAFDCETTGLGLDAEVIGFSIAGDENTGFYIVTAYWDKEKKELIRLPSVKERAKGLLNKLKTKKLIMHNAIVDINWTRVNFDVDLLDALHTDTMIAAHLADENRASYGLKELALEEYGAEAKKEQAEMKASVIANGGVWEDKRGGNKEMYKADKDLIAKYGAKDTILTFKLFYTLVPRLFEQGLNEFFYDDESMPLFKSVTYQLNTIGLKIDTNRLRQLQSDLEKETALLRQEILFEVTPYVKDKYPGTSEKNTFNIGSGQQLAWLLYIRLGNDWKKVTKAGRQKAKDLIGRIPYNPNERRAFMKACVDTGLKPEKFIACDKKALMNLASKYKWVVKILELKKADKLLKTYAIGMQRYIKYGVIHPAFFQHGTTSGRFSSRSPNFQNLPRDDKRIKSCVISRPGKSFVGADYSQLEPRVFTAVSQDPILLDSYRKKLDFYSTVAIPIFNKHECSADKKAPNYLGDKYPHIRQIGKTIALSLAYGTTAYKLSDELRDESGHNIPVEVCNKIREDYFETYSGVSAMVNKAHLELVNTGVVKNIFGRPRRIEEAKSLKLYGFPKSVSATELPYAQRTLLNLGVNHTIQSTAASIVNRAMIAFYHRAKEEGLDAPIVLQVHDSIMVECPDEQAQRVAVLLQDCMENTTKLNGVRLIAEPSISKTYSDQK